MTDTEIIAKALSIPSGYAKVRLGLKLHPVQANVIDTLFRNKHSKVCFRSANESGKTSICAAVSILYAIEVLNAVVISTSATYRQITAQLIPALRRFSNLYADWEFLENKIVVNGETRYTGFSTDNEGTCKGFHATEQHPLLIIVDEACGGEGFYIHGH